jgi:hypothetical protein
MNFELMLSRLERFDVVDGKDSRMGARTDVASPETLVYHLYVQDLIYVDHIPEFSENGDPIDTVGWRVVYVNKKTKDARERTNLQDRFEERLPAPNGLHVFQPISSPRELQTAVRALDALFDMVENSQCRNCRRTNVRQGDPRFQMRSFLPHGPNNILFIRDPSKGQPNFMDVMRSLGQYDRDLYNFVKKHAEHCLKLMGSDERAYDTLQLQLIHYMPRGRGGIQAHIDSISAFKETIGPIFTVNMNYETKAFDLLPTLKKDGTPAVRLNTNLGDITMMDGESRVAWSHSIPFGNEGHAYTVAFKFPCQPQHMGDRSGGYCRLLQTYIPQNLAAPYREEQLETFYGLDPPP